MNQYSFLKTIILFVFLVAGGMFFNLKSVDAQATCSLLSPVQQNQLCGTSGSCPPGGMCVPDGATSCSSIVPGSCTTYSAGPGMCYDNCRCSAWTQQGHSSTGGACAPDESPWSNALTGCTCSGSGGSFCQYSYNQDQWFNTSTYSCSASFCGDNTCDSDENSSSCPGDCSSPPVPSIGLNPTTFSFSAASGNPAPAAQSLTITNSGSGTLNWTASGVPGKAATWCHISVTSGSLSASASQVVSIYVDAPNNIGTFTDCGIRISDPSANNNPRDLNITYTVSTNPNSAVCDSTWRSMPPSIGGLTNAQPVLSYLPVAFNTQFPDSIGLALRGTDNALWYMACRFNGGNTCAFQGWNSLGGGLGASPYTSNSGGWLTRVLGNDYATVYNNTNTSGGWSGFQSQGVVTGTSFGTPFRTTDKLGRTWQIRRNSDNSLSYYCGAGAGVCEALQFNSSTSSFSPATVGGGGTYNITCDYGSRTDSINPTVSGGSCAFTGWGSGTQAQFSCTAPASGNVIVGCSVATGTSFNTCAATNNLGTLNVSSALLADLSLSPSTMSFSATSSGPTPSTQNLTISNNGGATLNWIWDRVNQAHNTSGVATWCRAQTSGGVDIAEGAGGSVAAGTNVVIRIAVNAPSTAGYFQDCNIRISDPAATNSPQYDDLTYTVAPRDPTSFATRIMCNNTVRLAWNAVAPLNVATYDLWRNSSSDFSTAIKLTPVPIAPATFQDTPPAFTVVYYWVRAYSGGQSSNVVGPVSTSLSCGGTDVPPNPVVSENTSINGAVTCDNIQLKITDQSNTEDGFAIFRNTSTATSTATRIATITSTTKASTGTVYTSPLDNVGSSGNYYYWTQSYYGSVPTSLNANPAGYRQASTFPISPTSCAAPPSAPTSGSIVLDNSICGSMGISWTAVGGASSYKVYRNTTNTPPVIGTTVAIGNPSSASYTDAVASGTYYYWVSSVGPGGESASATAANGNPKVVSACGNPDFFGSDKDVTAINGIAVSSGNPNGLQCGGSDPVPASKSFKDGDIVSFSINLCNLNGTSAGTGISVTDTLTNLSLPTTGWNAKYNGSNITPTVTGTAPSQVLTFAIPGSIAAGGIGRLTFNAMVTAPSGATSGTSRFINKASFTYTGGFQPAFSTGLYTFTIGVAAPSIIETR